ncbi:hypothetical protein, partial [Acinetobacter variabilis]|uniref:hypothetical protein n=1 Tax=Acinetobacter variabilis TaxID=70346 RepID=UPI003D7672AB
RWNLQLGTEQKMIYERGLLINTVWMCTQTGLFISIQKRDNGGERELGVTCLKIKSWYVLTWMGP